MSAADPARRADRVSLIGLGNRLRGDDAIGPIVGERVLERLRRLDARRARQRLALHCGALDALAIVDAWGDARTAIVIDAARSGAAPGTLHRFEVPGAPRDGATPLPGALARASSHGLGLAEAISLGRALGRLPFRLVCHAIEARAFEHASGVSKELEAAIETAVARIADEIVAAWHDHPPSPQTTRRGD